MPSKSLGKVNIRSCLALPDLLLRESCSFYLWLNFLQLHLYLTYLDTAYTLLSPSVWPLELWLTFKSFLKRPLVLSTGASMHFPIPLLSVTWSLWISSSSYGLYHSVCLMWVTPSTAFTSLMNLIKLNAQLDSRPSGRVCPSLVT